MACINQRGVINFTIAGVPYKTLGESVTWRTNNQDREPQPGGTVIVSDAFYSVSATVDIPCGIKVKDITKLCGVEVQSEDKCRTFTLRGATFSASDENYDQQNGRLTVQFVGVDLVETTSQQL